MKTIFEDGVILVEVREVDNRIFVTNKMSDGRSNYLSIFAHTDGHIEIRSSETRYHPTKDGFDLWLN